MEPQIRYCTARDGVSIAYTVTGSGPPLLYVRSVNHLALDWRLERNRRNYEWLARRHTLVRFDRRGEGLSQREGVDFSYALDIEAVVRELRLSQFAIFCQATAARWTVAYPHQEQVTRIVFWNGVASGATLMTTRGRPLCSASSRRTGPRSQRRTRR